MAQGRQWFEADINYRCGHRGGPFAILIRWDDFVTHDHYKSFTQVN
ncbi:hypothetical protein J4727_05205 [Providencia rettgeri]|uniref:Uncharacterized protein n=1 Tax=Providencia rettgeri TaxID=587 RepID=A0A939SQL4_PRORE|nr:hypothetical protein [Providencia rettgeri]